MIPEEVFYRSQLEEHHPCGLCEFADLDDEEGSVFCLHPDNVDSLKLEPCSKRRLEM